MKIRIGVLFWQWIDDIAVGLTGWARRFRRSQSLELTEQADGSFLAMAFSHGQATRVEDSPLQFEGGRLATPPSAELEAIFRKSRVHMRLSPSHFVFRTMELPEAASPFLEGIVRAQIDRLAPWSADDAIFGWSAPVSLAMKRVQITVAATSRAEVAPLEEALAAFRVQSIEFSTARDDDPAAISLLSHYVEGASEASRVRLALSAGFAVSLLAFVAGLVAWTLIGGAYDSRLAETQALITSRRAALVSEATVAADKALDALKQRKRTTPSPVMILDALTRALPDDTHLTELSIEGGKVEIAGVSGDSSELIHLIEQSHQFTHAAFVAPTVRGPNGGDVFHIEAHLEPSFETTN